MKLSRWVFAVFLLGSAVVGAYAADSRPQQKGGTDDFGPYQPVPGWFKPLRPGYFERGLSVFVDTPNRIFFTSDQEFAPQPSSGGTAAAAPGQPPPAPHFVMILDANGNVVDEWKQWNNLIEVPHAVRISPYDPERNVWVIDRVGQQILKFSNDGKKLLLKLGEKGVSGTDQNHFGEPSDISFLPDGSFYVSVGYVNTRFIKFDMIGKFLFQWGSPGSGPGQFKVQVHDVAVDPKGRVFVADRGNHRIQIFDANGKYLDEWNNITRPSYIHITKDGYVWVVCGTGNRLAKYDMNGRLLTYWGMYGAGPGQFDNPHDMSVDAAGNLYVAIFSNQKVGIEKFAPAPGADRRRMVGVGFNR
jgi:sugar lactone lactonase YvrE